MRRASRAFGSAVGAGIVWLAGLVALGVWSEDVCILGSDAIRTVSGYTQSVRVWPPALVCEYSGAGSGETVAHTIRGLVIIGWTYVVPLFIVAGVLIWALTASDLPTITRADRTSGGM